MSGEGDSPFISAQELACILMKKQYDEMHDVLAWASENIQCVTKWESQNLWAVSWKRKCWIYKPTLYEALHTAWEKRDE